ncbi:MAG: TIGR04255 family protein [Gallionella sp.]
MGIKLKNAPVFYVLAQVQFNPILDLDAYVKSVQTKMREICFPDYKEESYHRLVFPLGASEGSQMGAPAMSQQTRYRFGNIPGDTFFLLDANSLMLQTTNYDIFPTFKSCLKQALEIVHEQINLEFVERVGLRYLDAILTEGEGDRLGEFLVPEVLGLSLKKDGELQHSFSETITNEAAVQTISRVIIRHGNIGLPMDLAGISPAINARFIQQADLHAIVDTDSSVSQREAFSLGKVMLQLDELHEKVDKSFKSIVTRRALDFWA